MVAPQKKRMVNSRMERSSVEKANKVLRDSGLTMSMFLRNSIDYIGETGTVPPSGFPLRNRKCSLDEIQEMIHRFESSEMSGRSDFPNMTDDELADAIRMEHYGY